MVENLASKLARFDRDSIKKLEPLGFDSNRSRKSLPPLQTLIAFEAAARLRSFTLAAEELNISQPAISQQVRLLEDRLQVPLFQRSNNKITLTEQGNAFVETVTDVLNQLVDSVENTKDVNTRNTIAISLLPSFASTWFASRIGQFQELYTDIDLIVVSTIACTEFGQEGADVAIRWGPGGYAETLYEEKLLSERHILVTSQAFLDKTGPLKTIEDLKDLPLIHDTDFSEWQRVIELNGGNPSDFKNGLYFGDSSAAIATLLSGYGLGIVRDVLIEHHIKSGALIPLDFESAAGPFSYHFLCPQERVSRPEIQLLLTWLRKECGLPD